MTPFNLLPFAEFSEKIPAKLTSVHTTKRKKETSKLIVSHFIDFSFAGIIALTLASFFHGKVLDSFFTFGIFNQELAISLTLNFTFIIFPLVLFSFFFFSYFMNHGQTFGMNFVKKRMVMESKNYREAFRWAFHSSLLCLSFGVSYFFKKNLWEKFIEHDYLYHNLLAVHEYPVPINLLIRLDQLNKEIDSNPVVLKKAS